MLMQRVGRKAGASNGRRKPLAYSAVAGIAAGLGSETRRKRTIKTALSPKGIQQNR